MTSVISGSKPFPTLHEALEGLLAGLHQLIPVRLWMVTRVSGDDWSVLHIIDRENTIKAGTVFKWSGSMCYKMVRGEGPQFAEDAQSIPNYQAAPINQIAKIGTYIGLPLVTADGALLGTLCAVDAEKSAPFTDHQKTMVALFGRSISTVLNVWLKLEHARQSEARLTYQAFTDSLTGLANRYAWDTALHDEEIALAGISHNALVLVVDLDGLKTINDSEGHAAGDSYLKRAAEVLVQQLREADIVARIGGDEFAAIIANVPTEQGSVICARVRKAFDEHAVKASIGHAMRLTCGSMEKAMHAADEKMYIDKFARRTHN